MPSGFTVGYNPSTSVYRSVVVEPVHAGRDVLDQQDSQRTQLVGSAGLSQGLSSSNCEMISHTPSTRKSRQSLTPSPATTCTSTYLEVWKGQRRHIRNAEPSTNPWLFGQ